MAVNGGSDLKNTGGTPLALLDSWDRNNTILLALPEGGLDARGTEDSPSVRQLFTHIHYVRLVFVLEDAPEFARELREGEWLDGAQSRSHRANAERQCPGSA